MTAITFNEVVTTFNRAATVGDNAFGKLIMYAVASLQAEAYTGMTAENAADALSGQLKAEEKQAKKDSKESALPAAYRSAKSVVVKAVRYNVSLTDEKGKPKGKTQLEKELKEFGEEKPTLEKLTHVMSTAYSLVNKLDNLPDVQAAKLLVAQLAEQIMRIEAAAHAGEAIGKGDTEDALL